MNNNHKREDLVKEIATIINQVKLPHPLRVAIDGGGNAGKTTFANELLAELTCYDRNVISSTIDGFHNPPELRRKQGKYSPQGYFEDSYNYTQLKKYLLDPLSPNGNLVYKESVYNFKINEKTKSEFKQAAINSILIFDGIFLLNEQLHHYWDYKIYIETSFEITLQRAIIRDKELFGGKEETTKLYINRYIPGQKLYLKKCEPHYLSDLVINNDDYNNPYLINISNNSIHKNFFCQQIK